MKKTTAAVILVISSSLHATSDAKAYIFAHKNEKSFKISKSTRSSSVYSGYCVGCISWKYPRDESIVVRRPFAASVDDDMPIRRVEESPEHSSCAYELPMHMMEFKQYIPPAILSSEYTDATDQLIRSVTANIATEKVYLSKTFSNQSITRVSMMDDDSHDDHSYVRQLLWPLVLIGVAAVAYVTSNKDDRKKINVEILQKGLTIAIATDFPPDLASASESEDEILAFPAESIAKERSFYHVGERNQL
ncbi:hypothetical protein ACHAXM_009839 [Skeletonema potamos]